MEVVLGAPDRVNVPRHMRDTRLCKLDAKMTKTGTELTRCKYKTYYDVLNRRTYVI